jgi:hypothetical protein
MFISLEKSPFMCDDLHMNTPPLRRTTVAAEVRAELARQGRTQTSLSQDTGIPIDSLRRRLNGSKSFLVEELGSVCNAFGLTIDQLMARVADREVSNV